MSRKLTLTVLNGDPGAGTDAFFELEEGSAVLGRSPGCDWCLKDLTVSRQHARISRYKDGFVLEDLGSTHGVVLQSNGLPVGRRTGYPLKDGDELALGELLIGVQISASQAPDRRRVSSTFGGADDHRYPLAGDDGGAPVDARYPDPEGRVVGRPRTPVESPIRIPDENIDMRVGGGSKQHPEPEQEEGQGEDIADYINRLSIIQKMKGAPSSGRSPGEDPPTGGGRKRDVPSGQDFQDDPVSVPPSRPTGRHQRVPDPRPGDVAALLRAAGLPAEAIESVDPAELGEVLREALRGLMDLLGERNKVKYGFRMEQSRHSSRDNNPLKQFGTPIEQLLQRMFVSPDGRSMPAVDAVKAAIVDLRWHQLALLAGMRGAVLDVIRSFDPVTLREEFERGSGSRSGAFGGWGAPKLWEQYEAMYETIRQDENAFFNQIFGDSFVAEYERQVEELERSASSRSRPSRRR